LELAASAWDPQSDGLIAACLNFRSHLVIDTLETRIGKPMVTSTQAVLWHLLRLAGIKAPIHGFGLLLLEH
jgi:maleate isomerase